MSKVIGENKLKAYGQTTVLTCPVLKKVINQNYDEETENLTEELLLQVRSI